MNRTTETSRAAVPIALVALHAGFSHSSLALRSIAAYAVDEPYYADIHLFESLVNKSQQDLLEKLVALQPGVIGFSTYLWNIRESLRLAGLLAQLLPDALILFGGPEAGPRAAELLACHQEIGCIIDGEGEAAFHDLMRWRLYGERDLRSIPGLVWRSERGIVRNPQMSIPVEEIPSPITQGLLETDKALVYWETSRGCPFRCTFCTSATDRLRALPLARVEAELRVIEGLGNKTVKLLDRSFHLGRERTLKLLQRFAATPDGLRFHLELNPDRISPEAMALFQQASPGKFQFEIGLQTLSEPVLNAIERKMDIPKALQNIRQLVEMNRHPVHLDLIVGLPGEDAGQCRDSLNRTFDLHPGHLQLGTLKLLPGTPLQEQAQQFGYRWDREPPYEVVSHPLLSFQEMARFKLYGELLERLWNSGYLVSALMWLVPRHFEGRIVDCFEMLLQRSGEGIARDNLQPDSLFSRFIEFLQPILEHDQVLVELLLWDYSQYSLVSRKTPLWIAERLERAETHVVEGSRRRLPVIELSPAAVEVINRRRLDAVEPGRYAVWPRQHKKGKPVEIIQAEVK
jgi:anaerobic magnesium-protoporphyrin IX monomethyl ester cyclase